MVGEDSESEESENVESKPACELSMFVSFNILSEFNIQPGVWHVPQLDSLLLFKNLVASDESLVCKYLSQSESACSVPVHRLHLVCMWYILT